MPEVDEGGEPLRDDEVHLWLAFLDDPRLDALVDDHQRLLTCEELAQTRRFHFPADQRRHLVTRALLRCTLSRYADIDPPDWRFELNAHGRPRIASAHALARPLDFNLSHSKGLVVVGVSTRGGLGVDTENVARRENLVHLARHHFAAAEASALTSLPLSEQHARFFEYWTLKEAYIKARGLGLSIPLDSFSVDLSQPSRIAFSEPGWAFWQWILKDGHLLALCLPCHDGALPRVRLWETLPLLSSRRVDLQPWRSGPWYTIPP